MNVSMSLVDRCVLKSIGPDVAKSSATLKLLGPKYRYVITGYPPFLKVLVDTADIDWSEYDVCAVVGGEGMSEPLRAALNKCFRKTISSFGASDLEINLAVETDFTIALRQAIAVGCVARPKTLYGREPLPMVFQYDPLNYSHRERRRAEPAVHDQSARERVAADSLQHSRSRGRPVDVKSVADSSARSRRSISTPRPDARFAAVVSLGTSGQLGRILRLQDHAGGHSARDPSVAVARRSTWRTSRCVRIEDAKRTSGSNCCSRWRSNVAMPGRPSVSTAAVWPSSRAVNQDFRESIKMIPAGRSPTIKLFASAEPDVWSGHSGQEAVHRLIAAPRTVNAACRRRDGTLDRRRPRWRGCRIPREQCLLHERRQVAIAIDLVRSAER